MPTLNDWVIQFQTDTSKVDRAFDKFDKRAKVQLNKGLKAERKLLEAKLDSGKTLTTSERNALVRINKLELDLQKQAHKEKMGLIAKEAKAKAAATRQAVQKPLSTEGRIGFERKILSTELAAVGAISSLAAGGDGGRMAEVARLLKSELSELGSIQQRLGRITTKNSGEYDKLQRELFETQKRVNRLKTEARGLRKTFHAQTFATNAFANSLKNLATRFAGVFAVIATGGMIFNTAKEFDSIGASMLAASGSAEAAAENMKFVTDVSIAMGKDLRVSAKGFSQIGTAARAAGFETEEIKDLFLGAQEAATAFGLSTEDTQGVLRAFTQIIGKGNVQMEELRGQLGDRLPGAVQTAARALGVTVEELNDMVRNGEVASKDFLPKFVNELRKSVRETGALAAGLNSISAAQQSLTTVFQTAVLEMSDAGGKEGLIEFFEGLKSLIGALKPLFSAFGRVLGFVLKGVGGFLNVISPILKVITSVVDGIAFLITAPLRFLQNIGFSTIRDTSQNLVGVGRPELPAYKGAGTTINNNTFDMKVETNVKQTGASAAEISTANKEALRNEFASLPSF